MATSSSCALSYDNPCIRKGDDYYSYNNLQAVDQQNLQIRSSDTVSVNGFYFS
jgi:hypothetical protein